MREIEWKLLSELMKNSRRSDRELAKAIGSSQPTVTRMRHKLEKEGYIKEYTMIPDFRRLGFELVAVTFVGFKKELNEEQLQKIQRASREIEKTFPHPALMVMSGVGLGYDRIVITFHENYASFVKFLKRTKKLPFLDLVRIDSFLISLSGEDHYMPLTLSGLANYVSRLTKNPE